MCAIHFTFLFFFNIDKIEEVYADFKPFVADSNFIEAKFYSGEVGPFFFIMKQMRCLERQGKQSRSLKKRSKWRRSVKGFLFFWTFSTRIIRR